MRLQGQGASLLEVVAAFGLFACVVPLIVNLLPSSMRSLSLAERLQVATTLAAYRMDECTLAPARAGVNLDEIVDLDPYRYRLVREFYAVDLYRMDVCVSCVLLQSDYPPVRLASRFLRDDSE